MAASASKKTAAAAPAPAGAAKKVVVGIKVRFVVESKNRLRRVAFALEKDTEGEMVQWTITFQLFEREKKTDDFGEPRVDLDIELESELNKKVEKVANEGLTAGQSAHLIGPAANDAKLAETDPTMEEEAKETVKGTFAVK